MMSKKSPQLRFEGFTDAWEERKLSDIADKAVDNRGKTPTISEDGNHPLLEVASLGNGAPDYSKVTKYLSDETFMAELRAYIREDDILFSTVGSIGLVSLMDTNENAAIAQNIVAFRANEKYDSKFLYAMLSTKDNQHKAQRIVMGAVQPSIKVSQLVDVDYCVTENMEEQRKLGEYFLNLDNLITLHQRKLDLLKEQKKGYLQKMFPKNGAKVPELRFAGFANDWEQRKLGDISKVIDPHPSHRAPAATEEGIPFIGIGDVNEVGNINYKTARIVDAKIFDEHHNRYDLSIPSIGIGRVASLGKVIRLRDDIGKYVVSPTMSVIQFTNNNDLDFLYSNMNTPIFQKQFKSFSNGSTRQSVGIQDLRILMVSLPVDIEEQQKIGSFFKQLDNTIALHQRKLDSLKEQKKGFLQKMFV